MNARSLASLAVVMAALVAAGPAAQPSGEIIERGDAFVLAGSAKQKAESKSIDVAGQPFNAAWRVTLRERVGGEYNVQYVAPARNLAKGDVVLMSVYARLIDTADESGEGRIGLVLEQAKAPNDKVFSASFGVTRSWQRFDVPAVVDKDFSSTGGQFTIRVGAYPQTLEIGGVEIRKLPAGTDVKSLPRTSADYEGRRADAPWRAAADKRIEQLRKADLVVTVVDATGRPVADADVQVRMRRHAFVFGSCYAPNRILGDDDPDNAKYRETFLKLFNTGVDEFAMKWPGWVEPATRQKAIDACQWMLDHGVAVRGHTMVWPSWRRVPASVRPLESDPDALRAAILAHIKSVGEAFAGKVIDWDVMNEPFANHELIDIVGDAATVDWFKAARAADPTATLYLNETSVPTSSPGDERYTALYDRARKLKEAGAPIGGVGMQAHFGLNVQPPVKLLAIYDRFETLGLPVRITELDLDIADEQLQADYWRDFLTASFSHANVNGIMIWGFWQPAHWRPNAAMFRKDWTERPIAGIWRDLIFKRWWTNADGRTDRQGAFATRGFLGAYDVTVTRAGKTATLSLTLDRGGAKPRVTLPD